jgi:hypothetical protein
MTMRELIAKNLPLNRKERFYTGTVFPMIVGKDNFRHLDPLFRLLDGTSGSSLTVSVDSTNTQFFTEYSLRESLSGSGRDFPDLPSTKDTPDIVVLIDGHPKVLIAFEAKMFDVPSRQELCLQMAAQAKVLAVIEKTLLVDSVHHIALLPRELSDRMGEVPFPILTWESLLDAYRPICAGDHFFELLAIALEDYGKLVSFEVTFGRNNEESIPGHMIYCRFKDGTLLKAWMGRKGGLYGSKFQADLASGRWRTQEYETRTDTPPGSGRNWFPILEFVSLVDSLQPACAGQQGGQPKSQPDNELPFNGNS